VGRLMEKIVIQTLDCYRHEYWKVSLELLNELNLIDAITEYSYLGNGTTALNEEGFAYLEIDCDCSYFDKAMQFYDKAYVLDETTLQELYDEEYEDYRDWIDTLDCWDTDLLEEKGLMWELVPDDLGELIYEEYSDDEEEDE
jgi:hypothetical protein